MKKLNDDIKNNYFSSVYLLYGEEEYLLRQFTKKLSDAVASPEDSMNRQVFDEKSAEPQAILDAANTMPFFAERRLILLKDTGFFKKAPELLLKGLLSLPDTTVLIFSEHEVDKRSKLYKYVKKNGSITEFDRQSDSVIASWIRRQAKENKIRFAPGAIEALLMRAGNDMERIEQELEKLFSYCMETGEVTAADVEAVCPNQAEDKVFEMIDAIAGGQRERAMRLYNDLLLLREPPMRTLALLTRQFHNLMRIRDLTDAGTGQQEIASKLKIPAFAVRKNGRQAQKFTADQLKRAFRACIDADEAVKTGKYSDQIAVELLIMELL